MEKKWYVVNTYSGHESKVRENLEMRISTIPDMDQYIYRVIVPEQKEIEVKDGVSKEKIKKMFPGYILVEMVMSDDAWFVVRNTPGVTGFIGSSGKGAKPIPLEPYEVDHVLKSMGMSRLELDGDINVDESVKVIAGPFSGMIGTVTELDPKTGKITILLDLFGQETSVEVELTEIEKA